MVTTALLACLIQTGTPAKLIDTRGRVVIPIADPKTAGSVLIFVIDGCPIARSYSAEINRIQAKFTARNLPIFLVFSEKGLTNSAVNALTKDFGLKPPAIINHAFANQAGVKAVPTAVLYDRRGQVKYHGRIDDRFPALGVQRKPRRADLQIAIDQFLAGKPISVPKTTVIGCVLPH